MLITNTINTNKSRNTGIILHKNWEIKNVRKHESGGLLGAEIKNANTTIFTMSAYLPTSLVLLECQNPSTLQKNLTPSQSKKKHIRYIPRPSTGSALTRTGSSVETLMKQSRNGIGKNCLKRPTLTINGTGAKFIQNFLNEARGIDLWRMLHPVDEKNPEIGHTCFHNKGRSSARLDYFLISEDLFQNSAKTKMLLGEWYKTVSDHVRITCKLKLKDIFTPPVISEKGYRNS